MSKKMLAMVLLLLVMIITGVYFFVTGVSQQLLQASMHTITESTHQGANALNMKLEQDFNTIKRIWQSLERRPQEEGQLLLAYYQEMEPNLSLYICGDQAVSDPAVAELLAAGWPERGILDSHLDSQIDENVFDIFLRGQLPDGRTAFLVKEYRTREIAAQFTVTFFDQNGFSYLVNRNGDIMVRSRHPNSNQTVDNIFEMIAGDQNDPLLLADFKEKVWRLETDWAQFSYNGTGMVFCYEPLRAESEWLLVSVVPMEFITAQTNIILEKTLIFTGVMLFVVLLVVAVFYALKMHENQLHTEELQQALDKADRANRTKGRFLMDMSHDICTPLNAIIGMTLVAQNVANEPDKLKRSLRKIEIAGRQLVSLVSDVLDMSQIEHGTLLLKQDHFRLDNLFAEVVELMQRKAEASELRLEVAPLQLRDAEVLGDPQRVRQILLNIVDNAVKYTPSGGLVRLELTQPEPAVEGRAVYRFRCEDTGIGMDADFQRRMFMPFERARNTTDSKIFGTGVGLPISKSLLDAMGGTIQVQSRIDEGSVFDLTIPLTVAPDNKPAEAEGLADWSGKRILLVEDNELNMEILEELLGLYQVQVVKAENGRQAVQLIQAHPAGYFDLVLMDIQMPVMDGYEAARQIRAMQRPDAQSLPIYAVSANSLAEDVQNSLAAGMNGHIAKPVNLEELEKVLRRCLG